MPRPSMMRKTGLALLAFEARQLSRQPAALIILVLAGLGGFAIRWSNLGEQREICYILYWREDEWVESLRRAAAAETELEIAVRPVEEFTNASGLITYPTNSHSIQLRPHPDGGWLIWYWYSGSDPSVLWPYARWFWQASRTHFGGGPTWREQVSPLEFRMRLPVEMGAKKELKYSSNLIPAGLLWGVLFFCGCQLPALIVAERREQGTLVAVALTPAGWHGTLRAVQVFYGGLALVWVCGLTGILAPQLLLRGSYWVLVVAAIVGYQGVALTIASTARTVSSASLTLFVYLLASSLTFAVLLFVTNLPIRLLLLDGATVELLMENFAGAVSWTPVTMVVVAAAAWWLIGGRAYRRMIQGA